MDNLHKASTKSERKALKSIVVVGNHLPRRCGIATFSTHLLESIALNAQGVDCWAIAMNDKPEGYAYPPQVRFEINQDQLKDYSLAADMLNLNHVDVVCVQHEYGIFGGERGSFIIELLSDLKMPIVTTLHTILKNPTDEERAEVNAIIRQGDKDIAASRGRLADDGSDVIGLGLTLEARGDIDVVADHRIVEARVRAEVADAAHARVQADADLDRLEFPAFGFRFLAPASAYGRQLLGDVAAHGTPDGCRGEDYRFASYNHEQYLQNKWDERRQRRLNQEREQAIQAAFQSPAPFGLFGPAP